MTTVLFPPEVFVDQLLVTIRDSRIHLPGSEIAHHQHARQAAALAVAEGLPDELVASCLLSGIAEVFAAGFARHPAAPFADMAALDATTIAVDHLAMHLPDSVTRPIALLPAARTYLQATRTIVAATGQSAVERSRFEAHPGAADATTVAVIEQRAGRATMLCRPLEEYRDLLDGLCIDVAVFPRLRLIS